MPKNKLAGKHPSYLKLGWSPSSIARKRAYDKKYASTDRQKKYRAELNKANKTKGAKGDGKDVSHKKNGKLTLESAKQNRSRNGQNGKTTKK
jgi:hypothetical protein